MKDSFNREVDYLRISVTDRCNLRCSYCMPDGIQKVSHDNIMRNEEIIDFVKESSKIGIKKIRITGGEPLVRKGILSLIEDISSMEGIEEVTMTTNGLLLKDQIKELKEAGLSRVNLSLDTLDETKFKQLTKAKTMLDYHGIIKGLIEHDMTPIKLNVVLIKGINDNEIGDFIELADQYNLLVRFIELMPIGHLNFDWESHYISADDVVKNYPLEFDKQGKNTVYYKVDGKKGRIGFINPISHKFCGDCNRIRLTADGHIKPCLHTDEEINIRGLTLEEVKQQLRRSIKDKPSSHKINEEDYQEITRTMNRIGG